MTACPACGGTGIAPHRITLECVSCQRPVTTTYQDTTDLKRLCEEVRCAECKRHKL